MDHYRNLSKLKEFNFTQVKHKPVLTANPVMRDKSPYGLSQHSLIRGVPVKSLQTIRVQSARGSWAAPLGPGVPIEPLHWGDGSKSLGEWTALRSFLFFPQ